LIEIQLGQVTKLLLSILVALITSCFAWPAFENYIRDICSTDKVDKKDDVPVISKNNNEIVLVCGVVVTQ
jgi:hypothetical protein